MKDGESIESRIQQAMLSRIQHFRDQAESLTFEGVRRLLEKDLDLDTYALDVHKKYVKQLLEKYLSSTEDENASKVSEEIELDQVKEEKKKENKVTDIPSDAEVKVEDEVKIENEAKIEDKIPTEEMIKEGIRKRATYFISKSEELTVAGVRRLLEDDLELKKFSLDPFKKLISKQLNEVLASQNDTPDDTCHESDEDSLHNEEDAVKQKKKSTSKGKVKTSDGPKKRKRPAKETEKPRKKKIKETSDEKMNVKDDDESSAEKSSKKEVIAPVYGKKVERLKSIIKACGMSVAPTVYKKAKQVPEGKREAFLIKQLQEVLSKEGLSTEPTEKEIKDVKRRKERAKELEGIDTSNIVLGSRRRSTSTFIPPPRPKTPIGPDGDDDDDDSSENTDNDDGGDDSEDSQKVDGDDQDEDDNVNASHSEEEVHEDTGDSD